MDRGSLILICIACSCYLIAEGETGLDGNCTVNEACNTTNAECSVSTNKCVCASTYVPGASGSTCEAKTGLDGYCTVNAACTTPNAECSVSTNTCVCANTHVPGASGSTCEAKTGLDGYCTVNAACTTTNAECSVSTNKCVCANTHVRGASGSTCEAKTGLDGYCTVNAACTTPNAECSVSTNKCVCASTHVPGASGLTCEAKTGLDGYCTVNAACTTTNAECSLPTNKCVCVSTYVPGTSGSTCEAKTGLDGYCTVNAACTTTNAECSVSRNKCVCANTHVRGASGSTCEAKTGLDGYCTVNAACTTIYAKCSVSTKKCVCASTYVPGASGSTCEAKTGLDGYCTVNAACTTTYAECSVSTNKCVCANTHVRGASGSTCEAKTGLDGYCTVNAACTTPNAECSVSTNKCVCASTHVPGASGLTCEAKTGLDGYCTVNAACTTTNAECSLPTNKCVCVSTYVPGTSGSTCEAKTGLDGYCTVNAACTTTYAECSVSTNKCVCANTHVRGASGSTCEAKTGLDGYCTVNSACTTTYAECSVSTNKCVCANTHVRGASGSTCEAKTGLDGYCTVNAACTTTNAECSLPTNKCVCASTYVTGASGSTCEARTGLDGYCTVNAACTTTNAECSVSTNKCVCASTHVPGASGSTCDAKLGAKCSNAPDCADGHAVCTDNKCACDADYFDSDQEGNIGGKCLLKIDLDDICPNDVSLTEPCKDTNAECVSEKCQCVNTHYDNNGICKAMVELGESCTMTEACKPENAICSGMTCICSGAYYDDNGKNNPTGTCLSKIRLNQQCPYSAAVTDQCIDVNANCRYVYNNHYECVCKNGYSADSNGVCSPDQGNGEKCDIDGAGLCSDENTDCINNVCICNTLTYDDNGLMILGNCEQMTGLIVLGLFISNPQTNGFTVRWSPPTENSQHVSGYIVQWRPKDNSRDGDFADVGNSTSYNVTSGIIAGKAYLIKVISRNDVTQEHSSRTVESGEVEQAAKPSTPGKLLRDSSDFDAGNQTVTLKWTASTGVVSAYIVKLLEGTDELASSMFYQAQGVFSYGSMLNGHIYNISIIAQSETFWDGQNSTMINSDTNDEEIQTVVKVPAQPEIDLLANVTATSFIAKWEIAGPSPGITHYTITVSADDTRAPSKNVTVSGFEMRNTTIEGLEEYWSYTVSITASTTAGSSTSGSTSLRTAQSAPGQVYAFNVDMTPDGKYDEWRVTWKIPSILERNSNITSYKLIHNGTSTQPERVFPAVMESQTYEATLGVTPETYYYVEVFAINEQGQQGARIYFIEEALAKVPEPPGPETNPIPQGSIQTSQKTITITVDRGFVNLDSVGTVRHTGIICFNHAKLDEFQELQDTMLKNDYASMSVENFNTMDGWYTASKKGFSPYRVTKPDWVKEVDAQSSGKQKRAADQDIPFIIGGETCIDVDAGQSYCNGPLKEDTQYSVVVVVCTNGGCLVSPNSGPFKTLAGPSANVVESGDKSSTIVVVGVVLGVIIVLLIAALVVLMYRYVLLARTGALRRKSTNDVALGERQQNLSQPTYESDIASGPESTVYMDLNDETRDDKSTYDSLAPETNVLNDLSEARATAEQPSRPRQKEHNTNIRHSPSVFIEKYDLLVVAQAKMEA